MWAPVVYKRPIAKSLHLGRAPVENGNMHKDKHCSTDVGNTMDRARVVRSGYTSGEAVMSVQRS
jgi:hypothetical protein